MSKEEKKVKLNFSSHSREHSRKEGKLNRTRDLLWKVMLPLNVD